MPNVSQIPLNRVPFLDERTNLVSREWYRFLNNLFTLAGSGSTDTSLGDLQIGPEPTYPDALSVSDAQLHALFSAPWNTPHTSQIRAGDFYDTTTQTAAVINTAYAVTLNTTALARGVTLGAPTSRVTVLAPGLYKITAVLQYGKTGGVGGTATTWLRRNGVDIVGSASATYVTTTNREPSQTMTYVLELAAGDYVEVMWGVTDTTIQLQSVAAAAPYPLIPSARVSISNLTG